MTRDMLQATAHTIVGPGIGKGVIYKHYLNAGYNMTCTVVNAGNNPVTIASSTYAGVTPTVTIPSHETGGMTFTIHVNAQITITSDNAAMDIIWRIDLSSLE